MTTTPDHPAAHVLVFRAEVDPADAGALLAVRAEAIEQARSVHPGLLRAELVRLDERTWLDVLVFDSADGDERLMAAAGGLPALGRMHALVAGVQSLDRGVLEHSTGPQALARETAQ
ncbi:hypothetical protein [Kineosporia sp. A_224]|uniref:hypothetical protein n=1 Tax=Kineosporia sp. A_224 TaxID=1962180 RepID=UPI001303F7EA|nr:hypothetical protein [Kineosporia sp. A_224]